MNITLDRDFSELTPNERKAFLRFHRITLKDLSKKHRRSIASISYALDGKRKKLLNRISKPINKQFLTLNERR